MGAGQDLWRRTEELMNNHDYEAAVDLMYAKDAVLVMSSTRIEGAGDPGGPSTSSPRRSRMAS